MVPKLLDACVDKRMIDLFEPGILKFYDYGHLFIKAESLVHDVPNCAWKIHTYYPLCSPRESLFYATDTGTLDSVSARCYDTYLIEANHTRAEIEARIAEKQARGKFAYEPRAAANHMSYEDTMDWLARNAGPNSKYILLHQHRERSVTDGRIH